MACSPPGSSVHGFLQARILEWVAVFFSRGPSQPLDQSRSPAFQVDSSLSKPPGKPHLRYCSNSGYCSPSLWACHCYSLAYLFRDWQIIVVESVSPNSTVWSLSWNFLRSAALDILHSQPGVILTLAGSLFLIFPVSCLHFWYNIQLWSFINNWLLSLFSRCSGMGLHSTIQINLGPFTGEFLRLVLRFVLTLGGLLWAICLLDSLWQRSWPAV